MNKEDVENTPPLVQAPEPAPEDEGAVIEDSSDPIQLSAVLTDELRKNKSTFVSPASLDDVFKALHAQRLAALCFSGGGIRSATFGLGIVQALAKRKLLSKFDYISTVSGGGYLGSWLSAWVNRAGKQERIPELEDHIKEDRDLGIHRVQSVINRRPIGGLRNPNPEPTQLQHLREYSNYMSPRAGLLSADTWTLVAIYLRNLFLNLTIFIPLIVAVLIIPRFFFLVTVGGHLPWPHLYILLAAIVFGSAAIAFVISRLPSKTRDEDVPTQVTRKQRIIAFFNTDAGVVLAGVVPLVVSAFLLTTLWAWVLQNGIDLKPLPRELNFSLLKYVDPALAYYLVGSVAAYLIGLVFFLFIKYKQAQLDISAGVAAFFSSVIGGILLWAVSQQAFMPAWLWLIEKLGERGDRLIWQIYQSFAVPIFLVIVLIAATGFVGFTSRTASDEDREWLARYGGWVLIVAGVWMVLNVLVLFGPSALQWTLNFAWGDLFTTSGIPAIISGIIAAASGIISLGGGFSEKGLVRDEPVKTPTSRFLTYAPKVAAVIFLGLIFVTLAWVTTIALQHLIPIADPYHSEVLRRSSLLLLIEAFLAMFAIGLIMALFVNVNKFSLHGAYRDRLVRAYLGASNAGRKQNTFTGFDDNDNIELHHLGNQRPFHVINATVNLVGGKNLAWQDRKAASFTMSALHCGSWAVRGYRYSKDYCRSNTSGKALRLGTAMAISGAAANPNMGYYSSSVVTFLMSLFNIRLGWWLGNTGEPGSALHWFGKGRRKYFEKVGPSIAILPLLNETLGRTDETKKFLNVSDGGHFENLALYEMVLRRCKFIILSDGAADQDFKFGEIANAIQKCKVDLGVEIRLLGAMNIRDRKSVEKPELKKSRFAIAEIVYPETFTIDETDPKTGETRQVEKNHTGWLLYTRPAYYAMTEPRDIMNYADSNRRFPHQSTGDQMYDEKQFEAYRGLGYITMSEIRKILQATAIGDPKKLVDDELEELFEKELDMRKTVFEFFEIGDPQKYAPRKKNTADQ